MTRVCLLIFVGAVTQFAYGVETFFDDFNRPESAHVSNGWEPSVGEGLRIDNRRLTADSDSLSGITRSQGDATEVSFAATLTQTNGFHCLTYQYGHFLGISYEPATGNGYFVKFNRADRNYSDSRIDLFDNGSVVQSINSTFQFSDSIVVEYLTFAPDGSVSGRISDASSSFDFSFPPREIQSTGSKIFVGLSPGDSRCSSRTFATIDNLFLSTDLPVDAGVVDGFDYPIGDRGRDSSGNPYELMEHFADEKNTIFPTNPSRTGAPSREQISEISDWYNIADTGNYDTAIKGVHPAEDWNFGASGDDRGLPIFAVADGQVMDIRAVESDNPGLWGFRMVIRHSLPNNLEVDSIYLHLAPANLGGVANSRGVVGSVSDFTYQKGDWVKKGSVLGRIAYIVNLGGTDISHLHFELRTKAVDPANLYPSSFDKRTYYKGRTPANPGDSDGLTAQQIDVIYREMTADGIVDPSDFIDRNRTLDASSANLLLTRKAVLDAQARKFGQQLKKAKAINLRTKLKRKLRGIRKSIQVVSTNLLNLYK